jgi:SAM-dependent methyltransferase
MLSRIINRQYRRPMGILGWIIGRLMARDHLPENLWTINVLGPQPADRILEIGFGTGVALEAINQKSPTVRLAGVDHSEVMVQAAARRLKHTVLEGRAELRLADVMDLPFNDEVFDKAFSIHGIYFWPDPLVALREIRRVLRIGGSLALTVLPKDRWNETSPDLPVGAPGCIPYAGETLLTLLGAAGFQDTQLHIDPDPMFRSNFTAVGIKV